jgi:hypothetical protein
MSFSKDRLWALINLNGVDQAVTLCLPRPWWLAGSVVDRDLSGESLIRKSCKPRDSHAATENAREQYLYLVV